MISILDTITAEPKDGLSMVNLNLRDSLGDTPLSLALKSDMQHIVPDLIAGKLNENYFLHLTHSAIVISIIKLLKQVAPIST